MVLKATGIKGTYDPPEDAEWGSSRGRARWEEADNTSGYYDVYLYRGSSVVKKLEDYKGTSYNFYPYMTKDVYKRQELMREAGKILASVHEELGKAVKPGISTKEIDRICEEMIRSHGCIPSFLNYQGYPASVCISINDEVVHGIPDKHRYLEEGDIVSLDTGVIWKGYQSDAARTLSLIHI